MVEKIGFIGLGVMGNLMANNLLNAGFKLVLFDVNESALRAFEGRDGVEIVATGAEVGKRVSYCITMLPNSPHVEDAVLGEKGIKHTLGEGALVIDMSTIAPKVSRKIAESLMEKKIRFLDAPVSGGQKGAKAGTLSIMVGGEKESFEEALPILNFLGKTVLYVGKNGSGQSVKLCNQIIVGMNLQAICEAFALGKAEGLDLDTLRNVLSGGAANSWMLENLAPLMIKGDESAGFRISLQLKDLRLALDAGFENAVPLPGTAMVTNLYLEAMAHGEENNGNQALFKVFDRLTGKS